MSIRTTLANLTAGNQPVALIDQLFQDVWDGATMSCTAAGTNIIALTPRTNVNAPTAYRPNQRFAFDAAATSTGSVTLQVGSLAVLKLFQPGGTQAGAGSLTIGTYYEIAYDPTLDAGAGGFTIMNSTLPAVAQPTQGDFKRLVVTNTTAGNPASQLVVTADAAVLWNTSNGAVTVTSVNVTINSAVSGTNGLDTGAFTAGNWYYVWLIFNPQTLVVAGLISLSSTSPTMPSGFTFKQRVGAIFASTGPAFLNMMQKGRKAQYLVGTYGGNALANLPQMIAATSGNPATPTWTAVPVASIVPTTAGEIAVVVENQTNSSSVIVAPNNNYGGSASSSNPPPVNIGAAGFCQSANMVLESTNIYYASNSPNSGLFALGWTDNI